MKIDIYANIGRHRLSVEIIHDKDPLKIHAIAVHDEIGDKVQLFAPVEDVKKWRKK